MIEYIVCLCIGFIIGWGHCVTYARKVGRLK